MARARPSLTDYLQAVATCEALKDEFLKVKYYADGRVSWKPEKDEDWQRYRQAKAIVRQFEAVEK
jgi:hypothetical protein